MNPPESSSNNSYVTIGQFIAGLAAMIGFLTVAVALIAIFVNQPGRNGDPGPIGPTGPTGPTGPAGVDIGAIMAYAGSVSIKPGERPIVEPMPGWLLCNGAHINDNQEGGRYKKLVEFLREIWENKKDENRVSANLPDLRGLFLRGVDHGRRMDPGAEKRGDRVGTFQKDALKEHRHHYKYNTGGGGKSEGAEYWAGEKEVQTGPGGEGEETRPKNAYVNWIIKY